MNHLHLIGSNPYKYSDLQKGRLENHPKLETGLWEIVQGEPPEGAQRYISIAIKTEQDLLSEAFDVEIKRLTDDYPRLMTKELLLQLSEFETTIKFLYNRNIKNQKQFIKALIESFPHGGQAPLKVAISNLATLLGGV